MPALPSWLVITAKPVLCAVARPRLLSPRPSARLPPARIPDRVIFDKLIQVLVFGCGYRKVADQACSATTIRDRRDQWIALDIFATLELLVLDARDRMIGLQLDDLAVDGCSIKAPCGGVPPGAARSTATSRIRGG